jgi:hypothetical protein
MNGALGPRKFSKILNETFTIYGRNFLRLWAIAAVAAVIAGVFTLWDQTGIRVSVGTPAGRILGYVLVALFFLVVNLVVSALVDGALIYAISEQHFQQPIDFRRVFRFTGSRAGPLVGSQLLAVFACLGLFITVIGIPFAVYFLIRWSFVEQVAMLEGRRAREALSRSSDLVKGNWWRVAGTLLVFFGISWLLSLVSNFVPVLGPIIGGVVSIPINAAARTLLYYDLRVRKEGYNFEMLAHELHLAGANDAA